MIDTSSLASLSGRTVVGSDGNKIGNVADVYESTADGGGTFATVNTGLFGSGASFFPLDAAELRGDDVVVPFTKEFVKGAPRVENDEELTEPEEQRLFDYYESGTSSGAQTADPPGGDSWDGDSSDGDSQDRDFSGTVGHDTSGPTTDNAMTRSEERLQVGTEQVEAGRARLRKRVVTETETATVPVSHQEVRVEREPITGGNVGQAMDGPAISEEEHEVVLTEERPVVQKEAVPVERVRLDTETVTEQAQVSEEVRKEHIEMDGDVQSGSTPYGGGTPHKSTEFDVEPRH